MHIGSLSIRTSIWKSIYMQNGSLSTCISIRKSIYMHFVVIDRTWAMDAVARGVGSTKEKTSAGSWPSSRGRKGSHGVARGRKGSHGVERGRKGLHKVVRGRKGAEPAQWTR